MSSGGVWITQARAAEILGVGYSTVPKMVARGDLHPRLGRRGRSEPSLDRAEVEGLAERRRAELMAVQRRRADRQAKGVAPPDERYEWLSVPQVAALLGRTRQAVHARLNRGKLPYRISGGRRWVRRDHLELVERARTAQRSRRA